MITKLDVSNLDLVSLDLVQQHHKKLERIFIAKGIDKLKEHLINIFEVLAECFKRRSFQGAHFIWRDKEIVQFLKDETNAIRAKVATLKVPAEIRIASNIQKLTNIIDNTVFSCLKNQTLIPQLSVLKKKLEDIVFSIGLLISETQKVTRVVPNVISSVVCDELLDEKPQESVIPTDTRNEDHMELLEELNFAIIVLEPVKKLTHERIPNSLQQRTVVEWRGEQQKPISGEKQEQQYADEPQDAEGSVLPRSFQDDEPATQPEMQIHQNITSEPSSACYDLSTQESVNTKPIPTVKKVDLPGKKNNWLKVAILVSLAVTAVFFLVQGNKSGIAVQFPLCNDAFNCTRSLMNPCPNDEPYVQALCNNASKWADRGKARVKLTSLEHIYVKFLSVRDYEHSKPDKALQDYLRLGESGFIPAITAAGRLYEKGNNFEIAFKYYMAASERGDPEAAHHVALSLIEGKGASKNVEKGMQKMQLAAEQGSSDAQFYLAKIIFDDVSHESHPLKIAKKAEEAMELLDAAAELGHSQAQAMLAKKLYENGNYEMAVQWAVESAKQANPEGIKLKEMLCGPDTSSSVQSVHTENETFYPGKEHDLC